MNKAAGCWLMLAAVCVGGCLRTVNFSLAPSLEAAHRAAGERPLGLLVVDPHRSDADRIALSAFSDGPSSARAKVFLTVLDLSESRHRAEAAPLHALERPTLVFLSPHGIILGRYEGAFTRDQLLQREAEAAAQSPALDRQSNDLSAVVEAHPEDITRRMALADFLVAHHNDQQAIPSLQFVSENEAADLAVRVRAWVALGKAHLWVVEPEKARHSAQALIATLGPRTSDAVAGGNLIRGLQDAKAKRYGRAREELETAVKAAADSPYGREASELLAKLSKEK